MPDIVILTARFGNGHLSAAENIAKALARDFPDLSTEIVDPFLLTRPRPYRWVQRLYRLASNRAPLLWSMFFQLADRTPLGRWWVLSNRPLRRFFRDFQTRYQPKVVVSTYAVFPTVLGQYHKQGEPLPYRLLSVLTDSISINRTWLEGPSDRFLVTDEMTAKTLVGQGIPADKIEVTGFPTPLVFAALSGGDAVPHRRPDAGAAETSILWLSELTRRPLFRLLDILLAEPGVRLVLAVGRRPRLATALRTAAPRWESVLEVVEWEPGISRRMPALDLVVTKAGGATVHEALSAGCPVLISRVTPGQEEGNARLVEVNGLGRVARDPRELARHFAQLRAESFASLAECRARVARFRRPDAAARIARLAAGFAQDGEWVNR
jgi:processive 1,2-diacylglycerol beta-glucosyltransferase